MELQKYYDLKDTGATPEDAYLQALDDKHNHIDGIKIIREIFGLSFAEAKTVKHDAYAQEQGISRDEYDQKLADTIEKALTELDED